VQALVPPQALHPLAIAGPALPGEQDVDAPVAVAGMAPGQDLQAGSEAGLVSDVDPAVALRGAVLANAPTGPAF
jgi:hypothetical protein